MIKLSLTQSTRIKALNVVLILIGLSSCRTEFVDDLSINRHVIDKLTFKITTFNIGHFSNGKNSHPDGSYLSFKDYKKEFDAIDSDIISINENSPYFDSENIIDVSNLYSSYPFFYCGKTYGYDCNAMVSKYELKDINETLFSNSSNRYYIDSVVNVDDLRIHIITTHLDWNDSKKRNVQIDELIEVASNFDYFVLCGDMNPSSRINGESGEDPLSQFSSDYQRFVDAGFKLANCGELGMFNTLTKYEEVAIYPWDNIVVSPTFNILSVKRENVLLSDHYPLTAVINIPSLQN